MATVHTPTRFYRAIGTRQVEEILRRKRLCDMDDVIQFLEEKGQAEATELLREYGGGFWNLNNSSKTVGLQNRVEREGSR
ncbi:MAG: hypothetical protein ACLT6Y_16115 [Enterocloster sp.]|uniref:hypothetical protein n=1 Tax=Enterocloster sp. TaxID=2719315 RepID=UPI0039928C5A